MAGVQHNQVRIGAFGGRGHALLCEQLGHAFAVVDVHLATEAFDFESLGSHLSSPIGDWWDEVKPSVAAIAWRASCASCLRSPARSSGSRTCTVTGTVPPRPRIRSTLCIPGSWNQQTLGAAGP